MQSNGQMAKVLAAAAVLAALSGCSTIKEHRGYLVDKTLVDSVQPGVDNKTSVERTLGRPTFISQFGDPAWYYVSMDTRQKPLSTPALKDEMVLRVRFDPTGNVVAVDKTGVDRAVKVSPNGNKTPTLGRDRSFFEDLFGNIGAVGAPGAGGGAPSGPGPNGS